jgi:signal transduction histidine kinase
VSSPSETATAENGQAPARLLIVDDVADNRTILARRFQRRGFEIVEAEGGLKALELIAEQSFDIVLLDWMMPDIEGPEVLRRIRETHSPVSLPVIMATAKTQSEDVVQALGLGANDYITKPVDFAVALARVETQVGRKRAEEAVWRANEDLERRIAERTAELVATNQELERAIEQARAANRSKDEFLTNMSHELRTPLNGVIGMAQMLAKTELTGGQQEMVETIDSSAAALQNVLTNLLDMVDIESGRVELARDLFDLGDMVRSASAFPLMKAQQKGLGFTVEVAPEVEGQVEGDPLRLRQILLNLLSNALKFTSEGEVRLSACRNASAPDQVVLEVRDTGIGFDADQAEKLFQRFHQADGSLTRRYGGIGLGLAICRELVEQMGGTITAESQPDRGAVFRVEIPLPAIAQASEPEADEAETGQIQVLCAEDHPVNRKVIEFIMSSAGIGLTSVENGAEAVEAFKSQPYDAVLMDMQMPVMDGLTAIRAIREFEASAGRPHTPVVVVTAHGLPEHVNASRAAGADRHVTKPIVATDLLKVLAELVNGPAESSQAA